MKTYALTLHARQRIAEREIDLSWVRAVVENPEDLERQDAERNRWRLWRKIPEHGDRVLCVVGDAEGDHLDIVTVFFDRGRKL